MPKIPSLPAITSPDAADLLPVEDVSTSTTTKMTLAQLKTWLSQLTGWFDVSDTWVFSSKDRETVKVTVPSGAKTRYTRGARVSNTQSVALTSSYNFNSNSTDQKGGYNGTDSNMSYTSGKFSNAATFNGTSSVISVTDNTNLKPTGAFTIGLWFKTSTTGTNKYLYQSYSANTAVAGIQLFIDTNNNLNMLTGKNTGTTLGTDFSLIWGGSTVTDGNWHYVVYTWQNNFGQLYLDGVLEASGYMHTPAYAATNYVRIGAANGSGSNSSFMNGQIDDLFTVNGWAASEEWVKDKYDAQSTQGTSDVTFTNRYLVTEVADTQLTMYTGTDYTLLNATISNIQYSLAKAPIGFPMSPSKWSVLAEDVVDRAQNSPTQNSWYNMNALHQIIIPIGLWRVEWMATVGGTANSGGSFNQWTTLSTKNNGESDASLTAYTGLGAANGNVTFTPASRGRSIALTAKTTLYLIAKTSTTGIGNINIIGSEGKAIIRAISNLL